MWWNFHNTKEIKYIWLYRETFEAKQTLCSMNEYGQTGVVSTKFELVKTNSSLKKTVTIMLIMGRNSDIWDVLTKEPFMNL